ncbi:MAG: hypothetical protein HFE66_05325 [Clostridiales bacterium]|jgi:DUF1680 family protein|nr:hypothetical protein [Clostridiales bacterium]
MKEKLQPVTEIHLQMDDAIGKLTEGIIDNWLIGIRESNPAILDMLKYPDKKPNRRLLPWSGEFAGKYITCSVLLYRLTKNSKLYTYLQSFIAELIALQRENGYLGCWPSDCQLSGRSSGEKVGDEDPYNTWDGWSHYHIMYGLLLWYRETGDRSAWDCVIKIADLFCEMFYNEKPGSRRLYDMGETEMNYAVGHVFAILYRETQAQKYLDFALEVVQDFAAPGCGDYYRLALADQEYYKTPKPRWESLHSIMALAQLYYCTGEKSYKKAFVQIWRSITQTDVHNTGGFSTGEQAIGNPYESGAIETCCTVAYMALTAEMLQLTGDSAAADALELSTYNAGLGSFSPTGRWSTYNTPMEGDKKANYWEIGFQCRPGSPDLNCCSVNAPRMFGELARWAYMTDGQALYINYYGAGEGEVKIGDSRLCVCQETDYPYDGKVRIRVSGIEGAERKIFVRIPFWSEKTKVQINDGIQEEACPGYFLIEREWSDGDTIVIDFDMALRFAPGEKEYTGKCSIYRGPLLLAYDGFYCEDSIHDVPPEIALENLQFVRAEPAYLCGRLFHFNSNGQPLVLCDMQAAGASGTPYTTWLPVTGFGQASPARENITRSYKQAAV